MWRNQYFKLVSILSRFWTLYGIFTMIATLQQLYLCINALNMQKGSDWTSKKLDLEKSIFLTSINFKPFLDVIWHFFMIATLQQYYLCIIVLNIQKGSDSTT